MLIVVMTSVANVITDGLDLTVQFTPPHVTHAVALVMAHTTHTVILATKITLFNPEKNAFVKISGVEKTVASTRVTAQNTV
jgi:hypothetical protein